MDGRQILELDTFGLVARQLCDAECILSPLGASVSSLYNSSLPCFLAGVL